MNRLLFHLVLLTVCVLSLPAQSAKPASGKGVVSGMDDECKTPTSRASLLMVANRTVAGSALVAPSIQRFVSGPHSAVVVDVAPLLHTTQLLPGKVTANATQQAEEVFARLQLILKSVNSTPADVVKLNIGLTAPETVPAVWSVLARRFPTNAQPAVAFFVGALPAPGALVAIDAVAVARKVATGSDFSILPAGGAVYVSGQAEKGTLAEATQKTLAGLRATIRQLGIDRNQIIQLKAFLQPMSDVAVVMAEMKTFFADQKLDLPPVVFVEWSGSAPVEIELIATMEGSISSVGSPEPVEYITPSGLKASPVYSRVVRVNVGRRVYVSGLYASSPGLSAADQVNDTFTTLQSLMKQAGGDLRHLVKATYYVSDEEISKKLNELRPAWFAGPNRPPAASKAAIRGTGIEGRHLAMDIIAALPTPPAKP
ncbi:MAG TPA: RidA family protein [Roseimicrobium sp.]|nr:RidA family protein [Roseimicrobium sp.]